MPKVKIAVAVLVMVMLLLLPAVALAQPNVCGFYGMATVDGQAVEDGTMVTAMIDGEEAVSTTTSGSSYVIKVAGEYDGKTVQFVVGDGNAAPAQVAWEAGDVVALDLNAMSEAMGPTQIELKPAAGVATNVCGGGFTPYQTVAISFDGEEITSGQADGTGAFCAVLAPTTTEAGDYTVVANDGYGHSAEATFAVVAAQGPEGPAGAAGETGPAGPAGEAGEQGEDGSSAGSTLAIVALIIAIIAVILAIVFGMRSKQPAA